MNIKTTTGLLLLLITGYLIGDVLAGNQVLDSYISSSDAFYYNGDSVHDQEELALRNDAIAAAFNHTLSRETADAEPEQVTVKNETNPKLEFTAKAGCASNLDTAGCKQCFHQLKRRLQNSNPQAVGARMRVDGECKLRFENYQFYTFDV